MIVQIYVFSNVVEYDMRHIFFCFAPAFRICACTKVTFLFFLLNTKEKGGRQTSSRYPLYIHKSNR